MRVGEGAGEDQRVRVRADWLVETEAAAVQQQLVYVLFSGLSSARRWVVGVGGLTAQLRPRSRPRMPSFFRTTDMPCTTPLYIFGASFLAWSSPCNCNLARY